MASVINVFFNTDEEKMMDSDVHRSNPLDTHTRKLFAPFRIFRGLKSILYDVKGLEKSFKGIGEAES